MGWPARTRAKWLAFSKVSAGLVGLEEMRAEWPSIARKRAGAIIFSRISAGALTFARKNLSYRSTSSAQQRRIICSHMNKRADVRRRTSRFGFLIMFHRNTQETSRF